MMAGLSGFLAACRSMQLYEAFSLPPWNHALSPFSRVPVCTVSKSLSQLSSSLAILPQNLCGSEMDSLYIVLYSSMSLI